VFSTDVRVLSYVKYYCLAAGDGILQRTSGAHDNTILLKRRLVVINYRRVAGKLSVINRVAITKKTRYARTPSDSLTGLFFLLSVGGRAVQTNGTCQQVARVTFIDKCIFMNSDLILEQR